MTLNWNNAIWLANRQMRDNSISYAFSAVYFLFMGFILAADNSWSVEFALPILMFILIQPSLSPRYMTFKDDNDVTRQQMFLHSLPIPFATIVQARMIAMLVAGLINAPLLFIPFWYIGPEWSSFGHFLAWSAFWIGMALVGAGMALVQEFWISFKDWIKLNFVSVLVVFAVLFVTVVFTDIRPYAWSVDTANENPWLLGISGLVVGVIGMWLGAIFATRGFREKEFTV